MVGPVMASEPTMLINRGAPPKSPPLKNRHSEYGVIKAGGVDLASRQFGLATCAAKRML
jgi:hypothetical protein